MKSNLSVFSFVGCSFDFVPKKPWPNSRSCGFNLLLQFLLRVL
jgi:hypothetical protein